MLKIIDLLFYQVEQSLLCNRQVCMLSHTLLYKPKYESNFDELEEECNFAPTLGFNGEWVIQL